MAQDSFDCDGDKEQKCLRLLKNKSDDIERYDHVQFLIREINVAAKSQVDAKKDEVVDDMEFLCEGESCLSEGRLTYTNCLTNLVTNVAS